jgi:isoleucyl-tRNA synthetase
LAHNRSVLHGQTLQRLNGNNRLKFDSVHLAEFPISVENYVNKILESKMQKAQNFIIGFITRKKMIKVRQPLQVMIPVLDDNQRVEIEAISDLIKAEVNVKEIVLWMMLQVF